MNKKLKELAKKYKVRLTKKVTKTVKGKKISIRKLKSPELIKKQINNKRKFGTGSKLPKPATLKSSSSLSIETIYLSDNSKSSSSKKRKSNVKQQSNGSNAENVLGNEDLLRIIYNKGRLNPHDMESLSKVNRDLRKSSKAVKNHYDRAANLSNIYRTNRTKRIKLLKRIADIYTNNETHLYQLADLFINNMSKSSLIDQILKANIEYNYNTIKFNDDVIGMLFGNRFINGNRYKELYEIFYDIFYEKYTVDKNIIKDFAKEYINSIDVGSTDVDVIEEFLHSFKYTEIQNIYTIPKIKKFYNKLTNKEIFGVLVSYYWGNDISIN